MPSGWPSPATITTTDGKELTGDVAAPIWLVDQDGKTTRLVLHKRNKSEKGRPGKIRQPVYVSTIVFTDVDGAELPPEVQQAEEGEPAEEEAQAGDKTSGDAAPPKEPAAQDANPPGKPDSK